MQAKAPYTVKDLQERLLPTGTYVKSQHHGRFKGMSRLHLFNLDSAGMVEFLPLPVPPQAPQPQLLDPSPLRVRKVTIVHHDVRSKPLTIGVTVHKDATYGEVKLLDAALSRA